MSEVPESRVRSGSRGPSLGSAPSLLLTVLGELVLPADQPVWTESFLYVLTRMGITEATGRMAIARAADADWIVREKRGREVLWTVGEGGKQLIFDINERVSTLTYPVDIWDGNGIFLNVSVPFEKRSIRKRLYSALGWAGFGNPVPGLWTNPHTERIEEARAIIDDLGLRESTIVSVGAPADLGLTVPEIIARAWDLDTVAARYVKFLEAYDSVDPAPGDDLLFNYLALVEEWRHFPEIDPQLPRDVLPDWIGRKAAVRVDALREEWGAGARTRWSEIASKGK